MVMKCYLYILFKEKRHERTEVYTYFIKVKSLYDVKIINLPSKTTHLHLFV